MALVSNTISGAEIATLTAAAAPTVSETITSPGDGVYLEINIGGTATVITLNRYGTNPAGDAETDYVSASLTNTSRCIPVTTDFLDPSTGSALLQLSNVTAVTARLWRFAGH